MSGPTETRPFYSGHPDGGRRDTSGVEWFRTDGYSGWYHWADGKLITNQSPAFPGADA